jgi:predicted ribosome quality control (RQC) complex YloA/Tae2 family protein
MSRAAGTPDVGDDAAQRITRSIRKELTRLERRLVAITRDVNRADEALAIQHRAGLLARTKLPARGATSIEVIDYALDPPSTIAIELDPALEPRVQVEGWFKTARRYLRGAMLGRERAIVTQGDVTFLRAALAELEATDGDSIRVDALIRDPRIARLAAAPRPRAERERHAGGRRPFREFLASGGHRVLVGRGSNDNDELTTRIARPQDVFLHVQGATGAHVIVPRNKGEVIAPELLVDAALLAHHFSAVASDARSDVAYTERRYVQKRKGSAPGAVQLLRSKVLHLVVDPERLRQLIATEVR